MKDSVNGTITFNSETLYRGTIFNNIRLTFKDGKIVNAVGRLPGEHEEAQRDPRRRRGRPLHRRVSLAFNPFITAPMKDILFDEKIAGSFHFTPGQAYEEADNGNSSQIHWDMV